MPLLLVFALINRPEIFDLRPGSSLVEYLIDEGFDVFLVDWGYPDEEDADMGLDEYVCDELEWAVRETLRASGAEELSLMGWCIGATLCAMYCGLDRGGDEPPVKNLALLTMPIDGRGSTYANWVARRGLRRRRRERAVGLGPRRRDRFRQQDDEAGDELLDDVPPAVGGSPGGDGPARGVPVDGQVGRATTHRSPAGRGRSGSA